MLTRQLTSMPDCLEFWVIRENFSHTEELGADEGEILTEKRKSSRNQNC
jgi:hypothetical protein